MKRQLKGSKGLHQDSVTAFAGDQLSSRKLLSRTGLPLGPPCAELGWRQTS